MMKGAVSWLTVLILMFFAGLYLKWSLIDKPPLVVLVGYTITEEVQPGGIARFYFESRKVRECPATSLQTIRDAEGVLYFFDIAAGYNPTGMNDGVYTVPVPEDIALGRAAYWETVTYRCNPITSHIVRTEPLHFIVIP